MYLTLNLHWISLINSDGWQWFLQDVASKSLSGLESLVDQIPNIGADGDPQQQQQQHHQLQQQYHMQMTHPAGLVNHPAGFSGHYAAPSTSPYSPFGTAGGHHSLAYSHPHGPPPPTAAPHPPPPPHSYAPAPGSHPSSYSQGELVESFFNRSTYK